MLFKGLHSTALQMLVEIGPIRVKVYILWYWNFAHSKKRPFLIFLLSIFQSIQGLEDTHRKSFKAHHYKHFLSNYNWKWNRIIWVNIKS